MQDKPKIPNNILQAEVCFPQFIAAEKWDYFLSSSLGQINQSIPLIELVNSHRTSLPQKSRRGKKPLLDLHGKIALMFLKSYLDLSDKDLIERLNTDYSLQYFCHCYIPSHASIRDTNLPSGICVELGNYIDYEDMQKILAQSWKPEMEHTQFSFQDATCYETSMRYPTGAKILFESMEYIEKYMRKLCKKHKIRMPRNKYKDQKIKTLSYFKKRRKTHKVKRKRIRSLLYITHKQIEQMDKLLEEYTINEGQFLKRYQVIKKIVEQRQQWYDGQKPEEVIVSIDKPYIRAIVRGKENKRVEFGAKVNMLQVDGINFVEHLSFKAFHEGNRLQNGISLHRTLFGKCSAVAADAIYATNNNRSYCSSNNIYNNFKRKGRPSKIENQKQSLRIVLDKERSTRLEGSFGVEKERYGLREIKARTAETEILMIYFAVHLRNASVIAQRKAMKQSLKFDTKNVA